MYLTTINEVESVVGRKASKVQVHNKHVVLSFDGGLGPDGSVGATMRFFIPNWKSA